MLVRIPLGEEFTSVVSGRAVKEVKCEHCGGEFVYLMERKVGGVATSWFPVRDGQKAKEQSEAMALLSLHLTLAEDCDPVPCLNCGWYQKEMVRKIREEHLG